MGSRVPAPWHEYTTVQTLWFGVAARGSMHEGENRPGFDPLRGHQSSLTLGGVEESGCPRRAHNPEIVGSNPTPVPRPSDISTWHCEGSGSSTK